MMTLLIFLTTVLICESAQMVKNQHGTAGCSQSRDCGGDCCRDANNRLVDSDSWFGERLLLRGSGKNRGTCKPIKAGRGEVCSGGCGCDEGLECYRQMSGVCCPPSRCETIEYVKKQREYWRNCFKNPKCFYPVK